MPTPATTEPVELTTEQARAKVVQILNDAELFFEASPIAARTDRQPDDWDKSAGHFIITLKPMPTGSKKRLDPFAFQYSVGAAHRVWGKRNLWGWSNYRLNSRPRPGTPVPHHMLRHPWALENSVFPAPKPADVLYSVVMDAMACDMSHSMWCDEYGYDTDSIKARRAWMQCVETGHAVRNLIGHKHWEELTEALQNY